MTALLRAPTLRFKGQIQKINRDAWIEQLLQTSASELRGPEKVVAICIWLHVDQTGKCTRSSALLAEACGMDERSVRRRLEKLEAAGWLGVEHTGGHHENSFWLTTPPDVTLSIVGGRASG
jgi:hypothetical protein